MKRLLAFPSSGRPGSKAGTGCFGMARCNRVVIVWIPWRTPETKRPRVLEPEGVRVASGDRGGRPPMCRRSVDADAFVAQSRCWREHAQPAALRQQRVVFGVVSDEVHGRDVFEKTFARNEGRASYALVKSNAIPFVGKRTVDASVAATAAVATTASRRDRAVWVARSPPDAGCRPGMHCDPARWVRAGTAGTRCRVAWPVS